MKRSTAFFTLAATLMTGIVHADETVVTATLDLKKIFQAAPIIYSILTCMSILAFVIWLYSLLTLRLKDMAPPSFLMSIRKLITEQRFEAALAKCQQDQNFCSSIISAGIAARKHGPQVMMDAMHAEGQRNGNSLWQRISLLNDVAVVAPMLGLLGTVLGLFFAFYQTDQTAETINGIFDGLGIAIGTTVAGLVVAIGAMVFYSSLKFRLVSLLNAIENEVLSLVSIVDLKDQQSEATEEA